MKNLLRKINNSVDILQQIQQAQSQQVQGTKITAHIPTATAGQQQQVNKTAYICLMRMEFMCSKNRNNKLIKCVFVIFSRS